MESEIINIFIELARDNAVHIDKLNSEMGGVLAIQKIIMWFIAINVLSWVGLIIGLIGKRVFKNVYYF